MNTATYNAAQKRTWLGSLLLFVALLLITVLAASLVPAKADAFVNQSRAPQRAALNTVGWVYFSNACLGNNCPVFVKMQKVDAYRYANNRWYKVRISDGYKYVTPYTGSYRWAWAQHHGWVAVASNQFYYTTPSFLR